MAQNTIFPVDVGSLLTKEYRLDSILSADETILDRLYTERAISKARNLLLELSKAITTRNADRFVDKKDQIEQVFGDARAAVGSIDKIHKIQKLSCELVIGAIGWYVSGIPGAIAAGLLSYIVRQLDVKLASNATERVVGAISDPLLKLGFGHCQ